jgi:hypothetical protein
MRLLNRDDAGKISLVTFDDDENVPPYAILSHTWDREEVSFEDMVEGRAEDKPGYHKLKFCADQADLDRLRYFWVDTCCINKKDDIERQRSINSMFRWYRRAAKCYVYLADVFHTSTWQSPFRSSRWFTRGWTLQELIAPKWVEFFSSEGKSLGDKASLEQDILDITGIPVKALRGGPLSEFRVSDQMAWMERRITTLKEDRAYSLFGMLDVCLPVVYGEGEEKAFDRLRYEVNRKG